MWFVCHRPSFFKYPQLFVHWVSFSIIVFKVVCWLPLGSAVMPTQSNMNALWLKGLINLCPETKSSCCYWFQNLLTLCSVTVWWWREHVTILVRGKEFFSPQLGTESELLCNGQSVSQFVLALSPSGGHDQILASDRQLQDDVMGHLPWRDDGSIL
jgi:hypothetical protein